MLDLTPRELINLQLVSRSFLRVARDDSLWRPLSCESSPRKTGASASGIRGLRGHGSSSVAYEHSCSTRHLLNEGGLASSTRLQPLANEIDGINWYSEYITRNAAVTTEWLQQPTVLPHDGNSWGSLTQEVRGLGLQRDSAYGGSNKVIAPLDDGSFCVWDYGPLVSGENRTSRGKILGKSRAGILIPDMSQSACTRQDLSTVLNAGSLVSINSVRQRAYIGFGVGLNEVDSTTLQLISQKTYPSEIYALSEQDSDYETMVTLATKTDLYIYDPRCAAPLGNQGDATVAIDSSNSFSSVDKLLATASSHKEFGFASLPHHTAISILHPPLPDVNSIFVAGRFPSILLYDRRFFPRLQDVAHSGARLSSLTVIPGVFNADLQERQDLRSHHSLIAAGEYKGKGSLEIYPLSATSSGSSFDDVTPTTIEKDNVYRNRQSAAGSKILSVANHGAKIVYSDGDGNLKWVERDARTPVRSWNINTDWSLPKLAQRRDRIQGHGGGSNGSHRPYVREDKSNVVRKLVPSGGTLDEDEFLIWTGDRLGCVGFYPRLPHSDAESELCEDEDRLREREYMEGMEATMQAQMDNINWIRFIRFGSFT